MLCLLFCLANRPTDTILSRLASVHCAKTSSPLQASIHAKGQLNIQMENHMLVGYIAMGNQSSPLKRHQRDVKRLRSKGSRVSKGVAMTVPSRDKRKPQSKHHLPHFALHPPFVQDERSEYPGEQRSNVAHSKAASTPHSRSHRDDRCTPYHRRDPPLPRCLTGVARLVLAVSQVTRHLLELWRLLQDPI